MNYASSLDKIKCVCRVPMSFTVDSFLDLLKGCAFCSSYLLKDSYDSLNKFKYAHSFVFVPSELDEGTVFISVGYNGGIGVPRPRDFLLEFNPSKEGRYFVDCLFRVCSFMVCRILRFDVAFDVLDVDVNMVSFDLKNEQLMSFGTLLNRSWYISPKNKNGRVKVYQKDIERKVHDVEIAKTLRIEITIECPRVIFNSVSDVLIDELHYYYKRLKNVKWIRSCVPEMLLLCSVTEEVRNRYLAMVSRPTRLKLKSELLKSSESLNFDLFEFVDLIIGLLKDFVKGGKYCYESSLLSL